VRAVDDEAELGGANGGAGAGLDQVVGQGEEMGKLWVSRIWAG
jgi:hypothetical protein